MTQETNQFNILLSQFADHLTTFKNVCDLIESNARKEGKIDIADCISKYQEDIIKGLAYFSIHSEKYAEHFFKNRTYIFNRWNTTNEMLTDILKEDLQNTITYIINQMRVDDE
jgi:hypothetical protein